MKQTTISNYVSKWVWQLVMDCGDTNRIIRDVYAYDENGVIATAETNRYEWEFTTINPISTRPIKEPDFSRKNGFLIRADNDYLVTGRAQYELYVHMDNLPTDERIVWKKHRIHIGGISGSFHVGDCEFHAYRLNKRFESATDDAEKRLKWCEHMHYINDIPIWGSMSMNSLEERIRVFDAITEELHSLHELALEVEGESLDTLIEECV